MYRFHCCLPEHWRLERNGWYVLCQLMSFSVYKAFNKLQGTMWVFYITKRGKKKAKPEHGRKMARKSDIKRRLHINFPSMQQVHIYLSSLHKKVKKKKISSCLPLLYTMQLFLLSSTPCQVTSSSHLGPAVSTIGTEAFVFCRKDDNKQMPFVRLD